MKPITRRLMNAGDWRQVYQYDGSSLSFTIYACDQFPGMTIAYERRGAGKVKTFYTVFGKRTDSPTQAVRLWNQRVQDAVH